MIGISIKPTIGIGDALQFSSLPENYFRAKGEKLVDISRPWFFDYNPFVIRDAEAAPTRTVEMWNFGPRQWDWPLPRENRPAVYLSNAEIPAALFGVPADLNLPRLYRFEEFPYHQREMIILHTDGISHGEMPIHVVQHVIKKYRDTGNLFHLAGKTSRDYGLPKLITPTLWDLAQVISKAKMFIGVDSGPSWIAACYPDVIKKKLRTKPAPEMFENWVPLEIGNIHSHWDSREHMIFNVTDRDIGFTWSYRKI